MSNERPFRADGGIVEGNLVPVSGPSRVDDIADLSTKCKEAYALFLQKIDECSDNNVKVFISPLKEIISNLSDQNQALVTLCQETELEATMAMEKMAGRLNQQSAISEVKNSSEQLANESSEDVQALLQLLKQMVLKNNVSLDDFTFHTVNREEIEKTIAEWQPNERSLESRYKSIFPERKSLEISVEEIENENDEPQNNPLLVAVSKADIMSDDDDCTCNNVVESDDDTNKHFFLRIPCRPVDHESAASYVRNLDNRTKVFRLEVELAQRDEELNTVRETFKSSETNFQECKWALAAEVAEKHDQIVELRRVVGNLEEKLRQADKQTHFKDDIIKKMRTELKTAKTSETKRLCDVVTELTERQNKMEVASNGEPKYNNINYSLIDVLGNVEDVLKNLPSDLGRSEAERLAQIKHLLLHQPEHAISDGEEVSPVALSNETIRRPGPLQDILHSLDEMIGVIKRNQISENGDWDCQEKLETLGKDIRVVESQLSLIAENGDTNLISNNQQLKDLVKLVDEILSELSVNTSHNGNPSVLDLKQRIIILRDHLLNIYLPELKAQLASERKMVRNKEETMQNLHKMVELREQQVQNFGQKVVDLEMQLEDQRKVIAELQRAVQDSKKSERKAENNEICSLRFQICELEMKHKAFQKEVQKSYDALESSQTENLNLRRKLQTVGEDLRDLKFEFRNHAHKNALLENNNHHLEQALRGREAETLILQQQAHILEKELESAEERGEGRSALDSKIITALRTKVDGLESQLRGLQNDYGEMLDDAQVKYLASKTYAAEERHKLILQNQDFAHNIRKLKFENESLHQQACQYRSDEEAARSELRRQQDNEQRVKLIQRECSDWKEKYKCMKEELGVQAAKWEKSQQRYIKIIQDLSKKTEDGKHRENEILEKYKDSQEKWGEIKLKNKMLKMSIMERENEWENRDMSELNELERAMRLMHKEMTGLKKHCNALNTELEQQTNLREHLESELSNQHSLIGKVRDYENRVLPEMAADLARHKNIVENLKIEIKEANASCMSMRQEALGLIQSSDPNSKKPFVGCLESRRNEDQRLAVAVVAEPEQKGKLSDPWSPKPPAAHSVWQRQTRLNDSSEYFVESGFQSMLQSPVPTTPGQVHDYAEF